MVKYIDIPIQHISDNMVTAMNRHGDSAMIRETVAKLRREVPGIVLRSTAIVGFPGETDEDFELTKYLADKGIVVSIGHSAATYEQACMAYANGAKCLTHVYNGMTPFNHRANGLVGAAFRLRTMYGEVICDGNHSTTAALNMFFMSKGPDYSIMVSDALMAKGTPIGSRHIFGGNEILIYPDGSAHLTKIDTLAGSALQLNKGLKIAFSSGTVMGMTVVGLGLFDISFWFILLTYVISSFSQTGFLWIFSFGKASFCDFIVIIP